MELEIARILGRLNIPYSDHLSVRYKRRTISLKQRRYFRKIVSRRLIIPLSAWVNVYAEAWFLVNSVYSETRI